MPQVNITISTSIEVPEGCVVVLAPTGVVSGLRLPDGTLLKPFSAIEIYTPGNEDYDPIEADEMDLNNLGVFSGLEFERQIEGADCVLDIDDTKVLRS